MRPAAWYGRTVLEAPRKRVLVLAGPNGAGKTTFAREYLLNEAACPVFVNADAIAAGLSPFEPDRAAIRAGRLMLELIEERIGREESFALETTLAGRNWLEPIARWRRSGYRVEIFFLARASADLAVARVAQRVATGGHDVPEAVVRRRFVRGRDNFDRLYRPAADAWALYDNSGAGPVLMARGERE